MNSKTLSSPLLTTVEEEVESLNESASNGHGTRSASTAVHRSSIPSTASATTIGNILSRRLSSSALSSLTSGDDKNNTKAINKPLYYSGYVPRMPYKNESAKTSPISTNIASAACSLSTSPPSQDIGEMNTGANEITSQKSYLAPEGNSTAIKVISRKDSVMSLGSNGNDSAFFDTSSSVLTSHQDMHLSPDEFAQGCILLQAAALGDLSGIQSQLAKYPHHANFRDYDRRTALHVASSEGHLHVVQLLVEKFHAEINRSDRWGGSPLDDAHRHRHIHIVQYLRSHGATTGSADHTTNLISAAARGDIDEVQMLLTPIPTKVFVDPSGNIIQRVEETKTQSINSNSNNSNLPPNKLLNISGKKKIKTVLMSPIDINVGDYDKRTALHLASAEGHVQVVEFLCAKGAIVNCEDRWGNRPIDDAMGREQHVCVDILQKYGASHSESWLQKASQLENYVVEKEKSVMNNIKNETHEESNMRTEFTELEMIDKIGSGAFGEIFKCRWRGTLVAAKCIKNAKIVDMWKKDGAVRSSRSGDDGKVMSEEEMIMALEDFRQETVILRSLRHPNIVMLLAYSTTEQFEVMISELMKCSLWDIFKANMISGMVMPKKTQIVYAQQICQGMSYLHSCKPPIIHRDLKPANLLIDFSGTLKISDFGLAKVKVAPHHGDEFRMTGETGSYRFMAPEVFRYEEYNETVDVYSFAMIFYTLLTGKMPWSGLSGIRAVTKAAMEGDRPVVERSVDAQLNKLLQHCWDETPNARPPFGTILHVLNDYSRNVLKVNTDNVLVAGDDSQCRCIVS